MTKIFNGLKLLVQFERNFGRLYLIADRSNIDENRLIDWLNDKIELSEEEIAILIKLRDGK